MTLPWLRKLAVGPRGHSSITANPNERQKALRKPPKQKAMVARKRRSLETTRQRREKRRVARENLARALARMKSEKRSARQGPRY